MHVRASLLVGASHEAAVTLCHKAAMDFVVQTTNQSLAHRLWRYACSPGCTIYPPGMCEEAVEVGPFTHRHGPCLVHFKRSRLSAEELNAWMAASPAHATIVRVLWLGSSPGCAASPEDLLQQLAASGPPLDGGPVRLQCYPRSFEAWLVDHLPEGWDLQPVAPAWVLHVVRFPRRQRQGQGEQPLAEGDQQAGQQQPARQAAPQQQQAAEQQQQAAGLQQRQEAAGDAAAEAAAEEADGPEFLYSLQPAAGLWNYAPWRDKRIPGELCKAAGKLAEALVASGLRWTTGVAVDLGAAPGGWTHVLAQHAQRVVAVDPADMDPQALLPNVMHLACKAEDAVGRIHELVGQAGIDLLVSDINRHPSQALDMLRPLLPLVHPGGAVILTLKFRGRSCTREGEWAVEKLAAELGPGFDRIQLAWLLANTQHEQTCIAFKGPLPGEAERGGGAAVNGMAHVAVPPVGGAHATKA